MKTFRTSSVVASILISFNLWAGLITKPFTFSNNTVASATEVNSDFDDLYTLVNGNIGAANLEALSVGTSELQASITITTPTLTSPTITTSPTAAGATWTNLGTVTTADINGGTVDGTVIGGASAAAGSFTTVTASSTVNQTGGESVLALRQAGQSVNCEINYSSGTITISGKDGAALSATNKCYVGVRSNTNGVVVNAAFTANVTVTDGATSQTDGNLFGITDANWASAMPMFFGVIYNGTTPYFTLSRKPLVVSGAAAGNLCQLTDTDCDAEDDVMILTTGLTLSAWVNLPITQVAWLSATYATTGGAWTFAETAYTGFNKQYKTVYFSFPVAQMGAAAGTHLFANGGTAPIFTTNTYNYKISDDLTVAYEIFLDGDGGTDGAAAVNTQIAMPFTTRPNGGDWVAAPVFINVPGSTPIDFVDPQSAAIKFLILTITGAVRTNDSWANGSRRIATRFTVDIK